MADLVSLSQLYENKLFRIPDYQRGYAWKKNQLQDFWDDIVNLQNGRYHYTGLLSLKQMSDDSAKNLLEDRWVLEMGYKAFHIVDGQQRITTFSILLNELVELVNEISIQKGILPDQIYLNYQKINSVKEKYISKVKPPHNFLTTYLFGYENDNPSAKYLKHKVFNEPFEDTINETYYTQNLKYAKEFFRTCLFDLYNNDGIDGLNVLFVKLTTQMKFNIHEIDDEYDVFVAFETMNNRGKKLTNLELLKNRLIYLTTLYEDEELESDSKEVLRSRINDTWKEVYFQLGRNQNSPLSDDDYLNAHRTMFYGYTRRKGDDYIKFLLSKFSPKNIFKKHAVELEEYDELIELDDDIDDNDIVENIVQVSELPPKEIVDYVNSLKSMAQFWFFSYFPGNANISNNEKLWIEKLNRIGIGYFRPLVAVSLSKRNEENLDEILNLFRKIERYIFICFRLGTSQSSYRSSEIYRKTRDLYNDVTSLNEFAAMLNEYADEDMSSAIVEFINKMDKRFANGIGFYGWRDLKYLLFEYEIHIAPPNSPDRLFWKPFSKSEKDKDSIEHILPQTPSKYYWKNLYRDYTSDEVETMSGSLGNLLALSQSVNSSLQNDSFNEKKNPSRDGRRGYSDGSHSEIEVSRLSDWEPSNILDRGIKLLNFMEERWGVNFESDEQKVKLLHLGFVNDGRLASPELDKDIIVELEKKEKKDNMTIYEKQNKFWIEFVKYATSKNRHLDIAKRTGRAQNFYDIVIQKDGYYAFLQTSRTNLIGIGLYIYKPNVFDMLESHKTEIEKFCGFELDWYSSKTSSTDKRILYWKSIEWDEENNYSSCFDWYIDSFDLLMGALTKLEL